MLVDGSPYFLYFVCEHACPVGDSFHTVYMYVSTRLVSISPVLCKGLCWLVLLTFCMWGHLGLCDS